MKHFHFQSIWFCLLWALCLLPQPVQAQWTCDYCYRSTTGACEHYCKKVPSGFDECHARCMKSRCSKSCGFDSQQKDTTSASTGSSSLREEVVSCQSCVARMKNTVCPSECERSERKGSCISRCAKYKCSPKCQLPIGEAPKRTKYYYNCTQCKEMAGGACRRQCGDSSRAGFVACEVSCIEKKCERNCNRHLYEVD